MKISEIFYSIQGEGPQIGMPTWFIRTAGCNLDCSFCDSKYAKHGVNMIIKEIIEDISINNCCNVTITGGEPFIQSDLLNLVQKLKHKNIYIETNGTIFDSNIVGFAKIIVSPKPDFMTDNYLRVLKKWKSFATFKFVINNKKDFNEAVQLCNVLEKTDNVYFMPQGIKDEELKNKMISITEWIKEEAPFVRLSPRLQIHLYKNKRGV